MQDNHERQKPWASLISTVAMEHAATMPMFPEGVPVSIKMTFFMPRPKKHFGTGKKATILRANAPYWHTSKTGDTDKLVRCVLDALTGIAWADDCQVAHMGSVSKIYGDTPGVEIGIRGL